MGVVRGAAARLEPIARGVWPFASVMLLLLYISGHVTLARRRGQWAECDVNGVPVLVSRDIGPAVIGILRPRIVLPAWALESDAGARDLMLRHEGEHLRARDPLLIQLARLVVLAMPWNPAAWWIVSRLKLAIELDCDARVLKGVADCSIYGDVLLRVATRRSPGQFMLGPAMLERSSSLARRIAAMHPTRLRFVVLRAAAAGGVALAILATIVLLPAPALRAAATIPDVPPASPRHDVALAIEPSAATSSDQQAAPPRAPRPPQDVYYPGNGISWPVPIRQVDPQYTQTARDAKIQGTVHLSAVVETNGTTGRIRVTKSLDKVHGLDDAAVDAAKKWTFKPCTKDGKTVPCRIQLELDFRLHQSLAADAPAASQTTPANAPSEAAHQPGNGVSWPTLIRQVEPQYTSEAMRARIQGTVYLTGVIQPNGLVGDLKVSKSLDQKYGLDQAAIDAAKKWLFSPCRKAGQPVTCAIQLELDFRSPSLAAAALPVSTLAQQYAPPQTLTRPDADVVDPGNGVNWPVLIKQVEPQYPQAARNAKIQGTVYLAGVVETDGTVGRIRVTKSLDSVHGLDQAAIDAAKKWTFKPCTKDNKAVPCRIQLELDFRLDRSPARQGPDEFTKGAYNEDQVTGLKVLRMVDPQYTVEAMRQKIQGDLQVQVVVGLKGAVERARVVESLDKVYGLDNSALEAAKKWLFEPGKVNGRPVPTLTTLTLTFGLH